MKLFLDDMRKAPFGWDLVKTAAACIAALRAYEVEELSLDHDLAEEHYAPTTGYCEPTPVYREKTGFDVVTWMVEEHIAGALRWPPVIYIHSFNPVGREKMWLLLTQHAPEHVTVYVRPYRARDAAC